MGRKRSNEIGEKMGTIKEANDELINLIGQESEEHKDRMGSFMRFMKVNEQDGALSVKHKELISLAIGIAKQCKWCIAYHTKGSLDAGATKEEVMETAWTAVVMGGGPALAHMVLVKKALEEFTK